MSNDQDEGSNYLGAMLDDEHRLVLVPLDPEKPWVAFRRMRAWMKRARPRAPKASVEIFKTPAERAGAEVIPLRRSDESH